MRNTLETNGANFEAGAVITGLKRRKIRKKNKGLEKECLPNLQHKIITTHNIPMAVLFGA